jgi:hypothetical protein
MYKRIFFIILLVLISFVPIWKVLNAGVISYIDNDFNFNLTHALYSYLFVWNTSNNGTYISVGNFFFECLYGFEYLLTNLLHLSSSVASTVMIYIPLLFYLLSLYKFINYIVFKEKKSLKGINFLALYLSMLAFLSACTMIYLSFGWANGALLQVAACLFSIYYFLRFIDDKKNHYLIIASLFTLIAATLLQYLLISFFLLFLIVIFKYNSKRAYLGYVLYLLLFILLNLFWMGNYVLANKFFSIDYYKVSVQSSILPSLDPIKFLKQFALINQGTNASISYFMTGFLSIRVFVILIFNTICLTSLFFIKKNKFIVIFSVLFLVCLQLSLGGDSLVYVFLFKYMPFFEMFRSVDKFYAFINLSLIVLLAFAVRYSFERFKIKRSIKILFGIILLLISIFTSYPLISGNLNGLISPFTLPSYYNNFYQYDIHKLKNIEGNIYVMPLPELFSQFSWIPFNHQELVNPLINLLESPIIYDENYNANLNPLEKVLFNKTHKTFDLKSTGYFYTLSLLNIKAILLQNDQIKPSVSGVSDKVIVEKVTANADPKDFSTTKFGQFSLLQLSSKHLLPIIYIPNHLVLSNMGLEETIDSAPRYSDNNISLFSYSNKDKLSSLFTFRKEGNLEISNNTFSAHVTYKELNPTKYKITLNRVKGVFPLVFSQTFNKGWKLYINKSNDTLLSFLYPSIQESQHVLVNGYANAWFISTDNICRSKVSCQRNQDGTYNLTLSLEFLPQNLYYIGEIVSGITFVIALILIVLFWKKYKNIKV